MRDIRCLKCTRLLAKADDGLLGGVEFKCHSCKHINYVLLTPEKILATIHITKEKTECPEHQFKTPSKSATAPIINE